MKAELAQGWPEEDGLSLPEILYRIEKLLHRFVVFTSDSQAAVVAVWIAHTHALSAFVYTPYLHISSPEKRCGKSRLLDLLELLVRAPWPVISPSEAVLYRKIEQDSPTLLLDEVDTIYSGTKRDENKEGLRAVLNAGFQRGKMVPRCVGPNHTLKEFPVFCAKALAGIGKLPATVADRSVPLVLVRRRQSQRVERFRPREIVPVAAPIREALTEWADNEATIAALRDARPELPVELGDRQADIAEPLLAIAEMAGAGWPERLRRALVEIFTGGSAEDDSTGVQLLAAVRTVFAKRDFDRISSDDLLSELMEVEGAPWVECWESKVAAGQRHGILSKLARMLKDYQIHSGTIRLPDGSTPKGYKRESFNDSWERYLQPMREGAGSSNGNGNATTPQPA